MNNAVLGKTSPWAFSTLLYSQRRSDASLDGSTPDQAYFTPAAVPHGRLTLAEAPLIDAENLAANRDHFISRMKGAILGPLHWLKVHAADIKDLWVPLITACVSFLSVSIAFLTLTFGRKDKRESSASRDRERQAEAAARDKERDERVADGRRREQEALLGALRGEKESVGFMAFEIARKPSLVTDDNRERLFAALCTAWVFESSSRARAFIFRALKHFHGGEHGLVIDNMIKEIKSDFSAYDATLKEKELGDRIERLDALSKALKEYTQQAEGPHSTGRGTYPIGK
jgi:hypothetical protein